MNHTPLILAMCEYERGNAKQINHNLKVYAFAGTIGRGEGFSPEDLALAETAAIVHDVGIRPSMEKYGSCDGPNQEREGEPVAREILERLGYPEHMVERVCFLVGHHHTYSAVDGPDFQALVEADFLVNAHEGRLEHSAIAKMEDAVFRTGTGKRLLETLFPAETNETE